MSEQHIEVTGRVQTVLAGTMFRDELDNKHMVLATISGKCESAGSESPQATGSKWKCLPTIWTKRASSGESVDRVYTFRAEFFQGSLGEALDALEKDHDFLLKGDVFTSDFIDMWITNKRKEHDALRLRPHPYEFFLYYDV